ncbi:MAG: sigma-70 family RNA polymerase sigma factor [Pseudomonadota bacterium]
MDGTDEIDDETLLLRIAARDRDAFGVFFGRYAGRVKAYLIAAGMPGADADEVAQEVMVAVWRRADSYDASKAGAATWVFTIARNRRIDLFRRRARPEPDPNDPLFQPDPEPSGLETVSAAQIQVLVRGALSGLPEEQRAVLRAAFFDGQSHAEVAERLDLPLGTVKSRIRLAFRHLRETLGEEAVDAFRDD